MTSGSSSTIRILLINGSLPLISGAEVEVVVVLVVLSSPGWVEVEVKEEADPDGDSEW